MRREPTTRGNWSDGASCLVCLCLPYPRLCQTDLSASAILEMQRRSLAVEVAFLAPDSWETGKPSIGVPEPLFPIFGLTRHNDVRLIIGERSGQLCRF